MTRKWLIILAALFACGCQAVLHTAPTTRVSPGSAGIDLKLRDLQEATDSYSIMYSGPVYNPSALLFLPRKGPERLEPTRRWKDVEDSKKLKHLANRLDELDPRLWAIVPADLEDVSSKDILAYIYTPGYASVQKIPDTDKYKILPVEEQFNPRYHDRVFPFPGYGLF
ncbi:MAG: hypothetical protein V5B78_09395 [Desulfohalobiaceae bacterium]